MFDDFQKAAIVEAYSALRAGAVSMNKSMPEVAAVFALAAVDLRNAFPALNTFEEFIQLGEAELGKGAATDGEKSGKEAQGPKPS
jgi:hypothetical protein